MFCVCTEHGPSGPLNTNLFSQVESSTPLMVPVVVVLGQVTLSGEGITISDSEEKFLETAAAVATAEKKFEEPQEEELELDLTPGALDKTNDPVRLYLREMGVVPLLTREGEVAIAKRIERGKIRMQKAISRSPAGPATCRARSRRPRHCSSRWAAS